MQEPASGNNADAPVGEDPLRAAGPFWQRHRWAPLVAPLVVYMALGSLEPTPSQPGGAMLGLRIPYSAYPWLYALKIGATLAAIALMLPGYRESLPGADVSSPQESTAKSRRGRAAWRVSPLAVAVGVAGVFLWVGLCSLGLEAKVLPGLGLETILGSGQRPAFDPFEQMAEQAAWIRPFLAVRFLGLVLVVPVIEEFFLRGFLMRFVVAADWWKVPFGKVNAAAVAVSVVMPMLSHPAEMLAAAAWFGTVTWLMVRTRNLWDCVAAHAVTNLLLGIYVVATGHWWLW